ncbi:hypothetical protein THIOM_003347 [Candidatus Thiomargarita nelsonii]|uniref:Uncharacterized protein n=1 Tax=Candidatus Thiomargarita nelsonii TaxID=1003181 RepID=A0A176RYY8_9GAMM|nr:hypothetical protein THIOM_003347 [Candidatus Thiomargarita nelsonii]
MDCLAIHTSLFFSSRIIFQIANKGLIFFCHIYIFKKMQNNLFSDQVSGLQALVLDTYF